MRKIFDENIWNELLWSGVRDTDCIKIIADGRQVNEYNFWVNERGYIPIGIITDDEIRKNRLISRDGYDQSELFDNIPDNQVDDVINRIRDENTGYIIYNNGNFEDLYKEVEKYLFNEINNKL